VRRSLVETVLPARLGTSFRWLLGSSWLSNIADGIQVAAAPLLVASETRDPLLVSLAAVLQYLPFLLFGLFAGVVADRVDRRRLVAIADLCRVVVVAVLVARIGWQVVLGALPTLVDQAALESSEIRRVAVAVQGVRDASSIRSRSAGHQRFAELIISVEGAVSVSAAHAITDLVEEALRRDLGFHEVVVHVEPC
jgi:divalent metal cation (Fe/Co/Zn/Cd) transporter